jgi:hypothetical protein
MTNTVVSIIGKKKFDFWLTVSIHRLKFFFVLTTVDLIIGFCSQAIIGIKVSIPSMFFWPSVPTYGHRLFISGHFLNPLPFGRGVHAVKHGHFHFETGGMYQQFVGNVHQSSKSLLVATEQVLVPSPTASFLRFWKRVTFNKDESAYPQLRLKAQTTQTYRSNCL